MRLALASMITLATALIASPSLIAQSDFHLSLQNGRVTLSAAQTPLASILAEWARVGQSTFDNADKVNTTPITIELHDVPEQQALQLLLRSTGGFVAVPRPPAENGASLFSRVIVLPVGSPTQSVGTTRPYSPPPVVPPPSVPQPIATAPSASSGVATRLIGANGLPVPDDQDGAPPPGMTRAPAGYNPGDAPPRPIGLPTPVTTAAPSAGPSRMPTATVGTSAPGVIAPAPQPMPATNAPATAPAPAVATPQR